MRHYKPFWFRCGGILEFSNSFPNSDRLHNPTKEKNKFAFWLFEISNISRRDRKDDNKNAILNMFPIPEYFIQK